MMYVGLTMTYSSQFQASALRAHACPYLPALLNANFHLRHLGCLTTHSLSLLLPPLVQMLRGAVIIFTGLMARFLLKHKLKPFQWVGNHTWSFLGYWCLLADPY